MAKDHKGEVIVWVVLYNNGYDCNWDIGGVYHDIKGACAHITMIATPDCGEEYKIEARHITSTKAAVDRLKECEKSRAKYKKERETLAKLEEVA